MNKGLIKKKKTAWQCYDMDVYFIYHINDVLKRVVKKDLLMCNLSDPQTRQEKIAKAFVLTSVMVTINDTWDKTWNENYESVIEIMKDIGLSLGIIDWLNERLPIYLKDADKYVDLECYKYDYNGKEYSQKEMIQILTNKVKRYSGKKDELIDILDIWKLIHHQMWW